MKTRTFVLLFSAGLLSACSSGSPPTQEISQAQQAVRSATIAKAGEHAPKELAEAQRKVTEAEDAMDGKRYKEARRLSEQARIDAEYATLRSEAIRAEEELNDVSRSAQTEQQELRQ